MPGEAEVAVPATAAVTRLGSGCPLAARAVPGVVNPERRARAVRVKGRSLELQAAEGGGGMSEPAEAWVKQMRDLRESSSQDEADALARKMYDAAQKDLDDQRAQAEYEREE